MQKGVISINFKKCLKIIFIIALLTAVIIYLNPKYKLEEHGESIVVIYFHRGIPRDGYKIELSSDGMMEFAYGDIDIEKGESREDLSEKMLTGGGLVNISEHGVIQLSPSEYNTIRKLLDDSIEEINRKNSIIMFGMDEGAYLNILYDGQYISINNNRITAFKSLNRTEDLLRFLKNKSPFGLEGINTSDKNHKKIDDI